MSSDSTQRFVAGKGGIGSAIVRGGQTPNRFLNLYAAQPGL